MYGNICEYCGAHLDPGEHCDCQEKHSDIDYKNENIKGSVKENEGTNYSATP